MINKEFATGGAVKGRAQRVSQDQASSEGVNFLFDLP